MQFITTVDNYYLYGRETNLIRTTARALENKKLKPYRKIQIRDDFAFTPNVEIGPEIKEELRSRKRLH